MSPSNPIGMIVLLSRRESVCASAFRQYWQDVHGPLAARLPGLHHYRQLHLVPARGWWPECPTIDQSQSPADAIDGLADMGFANAQGQQAYARHAELVRRDESNLFRRSVRYLVDPAHRGSLLSQWSSSPGHVAGAATSGFSVLVLLRRRSDISVRDFESAVRLLSPSAMEPTQGPSGSKTWFLEERDNSQNHLLSAHVDHDTPMERQYQAAIELAFDDRFAARRFFQGEAFGTALKAHAGTLCAAHVYEIERVVNMRCQGQITLSGLRGHSTCELISQVGAANQTDEDVCALFEPPPFDGATVLAPSPPCIQTVSPTPGP